MRGLFTLDIPTLSIRLLSDHASLTISQIFLHLGRTSFAVNSRKGAAILRFSDP